MPNRNAVKQQQDAARPPAQGTHAGPRRSKALLTFSIVLFVAWLALLTWLATAAS